MGTRRPSLKVRTWRALTACAAASTLATAPAQAQTAIRDFAIPAQDAASALQAFARETGVQLLFPYEAAAGRRAPALVGRFRDSEALQRLAEAAGLTVASYSASTAILAAAEAPAEPERPRPPPPPAPALVSPIVVTGTNIRGRPPLSLHVQQIGRGEIEREGAASVQQLLASSAPQLTGFGAAGQGQGSFEPRLRSLGGSSSASTLVLVDGHRITPGGGVANTSDPNVVPLSAVERIDILSDGASALYGSDAVAGVINIVTRRRFDGLETTLQAGGGRDYGTRAADVVWGRSGASTSVLLTYSFARREALAAADRDFVSGNQSNQGPGATGRGGANFNTYACSPATVMPAAGQPGAGEVFLAPYTGAGLANAPSVNGQCSTARQRDLLPGETAHRFYLYARQDLGERLQVSLTGIYSHRSTLAQIPRGTITNVSVWAPGASPADPGQANPFFAGPPGVTREAVTFDFQEMFGPGARIANVQESIHATLAADLALSAGWLATATLTAGRPRFTSLTTGTVCAPCAYAALNGSAAASGLTATNLQPSLLGDDTRVSRSPLTVANALDVWTQGGSRTSEAVKAQLLDNRAFSDERRPVFDAVVKVEGPLAALPGGSARLAAGGEYYRLGRRLSAVAAGVTGPTGTSAAYSRSAFRDRAVSSAFAELLAPLVSPEMGLRLVRRLDLDLSARIDHYSDIIEGAATTRNPKLGLGWELARGVSLRATYGTSFTAPQVGHNQSSQPDTNFRDYFATGGAAFQLPQGYPGAQSLGCPALGTCTISASSGVNGVIAFGANPELRPQRGRTWSVGTDLRRHARGRELHLSVTYWGAVYRGLITNFNSITQAAFATGVTDVFVIDPTPAQVARATAGRPQIGPIPTPVRFLYAQTQSNLFNLRGEGVDIEAGLAADTRAGRFAADVTGAFKTAFERQIAEGPWLQALDVANSGNTVSPLKFVGRATFGWTRGRQGAALSLNYVGGYYLTDATTPFAQSPCPANVTATGFGCQKVAANLTVDLQLDTALGRRGPRMVLNVDNLLDADPPWINSADTISANGSLNVWSNPIGRVVRLSLQMRW